MKELNEQELNRFLSFMHQKKGIDLSSYRKRFLMRRLTLRMNETNAKSLQDYVNLMGRKPDEFNQFLDALSINVSKFFRDSEVFAVFKKVALADIIQRKKSAFRHTIRAWSAGCAYGEEAYSLAILIKEELVEVGGNFTVQIWATDVDNGALEKAKKAEYEVNSLKEVNQNLLEKYFEPLDNGSYRIKEEIRQMVRFSKHSLISDTPLKYMDIIFCRNVMIYLNQQQQDILFRMFNRALNSKGYLVIGKVETLWSNLSDLFSTIDAFQRIYQKRT